MLTFKQAQTSHISVQLDFLFYTVISACKSLHFRVVQNSLVNVFATSCSSIATHKLGDEPLLCHDYVHEICVECIFGDVIVHSYLAERVALTDYTTVPLLNVC